MRIQYISDAAGDSGREADSRPEKVKLSEEEESGFLDAAVPREGQEEA